jgi:DNA-directed RNA polymerase subunit beta'
MLKKVRIEDAGDTDFLPMQQVDKADFRKRTPASLRRTARRAGYASLLGITKASLTTESFISAASFQESTRMLTEAAASGKSDALFGLKKMSSSAIDTRGYGFQTHRGVEIEKIGQEKRKPRSIMRSGNSESERNRYMQQSIN